MERFVEMSGLPDTTIRKIFSGETADPRFETVVRLVSAMGGSLDDILGKKGRGKNRNQCNFGAKRYI